MRRNDGHSHRKQHRTSLKRSSPSNTRSPQAAIPVSPRKIRKAGAQASAFLVSGGEGSSLPGVAGCQKTSKRSLCGFSGVQAPPYPGSRAPQARVIPVSPRKIRKAGAQASAFFVQGNFGNFEKSRGRFSRKASRPSFASSVPYARRVASPA